jgi:replicative DNA helicase
MASKASKPGDRSPPHHVEAEQSVLGAVLIKPDALHEVVVTLKSADDFFMPAHREIFEAMVRLAKSGTPLDVVGLSDELRKVERTDKDGKVIGNGLSMLEEGEGYLLKLASIVPTAENAAHYARIVASKATLRRLIGACAEAMSRAYGDGDVDEILSDHRIAVASLTPSGHGGPVKASVGVLNALDVINQKATAPQRFAVQTGIRVFDRKIGGLREGQFVCVAANPGRGKTAWAWTTALRAAIMNTPTMVFSLEMSEQEMWERALSYASGVPAYHIVRGTISNDEAPLLVRGANVLRPVPIWLNATAETADQICSGFRQWRARHAPEGLALGVVDYVQIIRPDKPRDNRAVEVGEISRGLKLTARELKMPIIVVSQLSRENMKGGPGGKPRRPILSDLRDSGSIEQDSDMIIFPWREPPPAKKPGERDEVEPIDGDGMVEAELIVAKHRNGPVGSLGVRWHKEIMAFYDPELEDPPEDRRLPPSDR